MRSAAALSVVVVLAGCAAGPDDREDTGDREPSPPGPALTLEPPPSQATIPCERPIGQEEPDAETWTIVDGAVALPSTDVPALQVVEVDAVVGGSGELDGVRETWWWAKHGLVVASSSRVVLEVPPEHVEDLRIGWGGEATTATPVTTVVVDCGVDAAPWSAFAGGYWVREPGCYSVHVRVDDRPVVPVHVGVGAPCAGQEP